MSDLWRDMDFALPAGHPSTFEQELKQVKAENERLRAALEKCADPHRYHAPCVHCCQTITECGSYIARAALKGGDT